MCGINNLIYRLIISHPSFPVVFLYHMELLLIAVLVKPRIHNIRYYWYKWRHLFLSTWISYAIMKTRNIEVKCKFYKVVMTCVLKSFQPHICFHKHDCNVYLNHNKERMYSSSYWNTAAHDTVALSLSYPCRPSANITTSNNRTIETTPVLETVSPIDCTCAKSLN